VPSNFVCKLSPGLGASMCSQSLSVCCAVSYKNGIVSYRNREIAGKSHHDIMSSVPFICSVHGFIM